MNFILLLSWKQTLNPDQTTTNGRIGSSLSSGSMLFAIEAFKVYKQMREQTPIVVSMVGKGLEALLMPQLNIFVNYYLFKILCPVKQ